MRAEEAETAFRLGAGLGRFWSMHGIYREGTEWLRQILTLAEKHAKSVPLAAHAKAVLSAAQLTYIQGDLSEGEKLARECLELCNGSVQDKQIRMYYVQALNALGNITRDQGKYGEAETFFETSATIQRELGNQWALAIVLYNWSLLANYQRNAAKEAQLLEECRVVTEQLNYTYILAITLIGQANWEMEYGKLARAIELLDKAEPLCKQMGSKQVFALMSERRGVIARQQNNFLGAALLFRKSLLLRREIGENRLLPWSWEVLADLAVVQGQPARAARLLGASTAWRPTLGTPGEATEPRVSDLRASVLKAVRESLSQEAFAAACRDTAGEPLASTFQIITSALETAQGCSGSPA